MNQGIVYFDAGVTLVGAADTNPGDIETALTLAPSLVAADGGALLAESQGFGVDLIIGDLDGLPDAYLSRNPDVRVQIISEQDTTDFEKCLYTLTAPIIIAVGFSGGRLDHHLAVLNALAKYPEKAVVIVGPEDICFVSPLEMKLDLPPATRLSLFPLCEVMGKSKGLEYPIDGISFSPSGRVGTSNQTVGGLVELSFETSGMLVILPKEFLPEVVKELTGGVVDS